MAAEHQGFPVGPERTKLIIDNIGSYKRSLYFNHTLETDNFYKILKNIKLDTSSQPSINNINNIEHLRNRMINNDMREDFVEFCIYHQIKALGGPNAIENLEVSRGTKRLLEDYESEDFSDAVKSILSTIDAPV